MPALDVSAVRRCRAATSSATRTRRCNASRVRANSNNSTLVATPMRSSAAPMFAADGSCNRRKASSRNCRTVLANRLPANAPITVAAIAATAATMRVRTTAGSSRPAACKPTVITPRVKKHPTPTRPPAQTASGSPFIRLRALIAPARISRRGRSSSSLRPDGLASRLPSPTRVRAASDQQRVRSRRATTRRRVRPSAVRRRCR